MALFEDISQLAGAAAQVSQASLMLGEEEEEKWKVTGQARD